MRGLMMEDQLLVSDLIEHAALNHGFQEIVSRTVEGPIHRYTYADALKRMKKLANGLERMGVKLGDRLATFAWNGYRHFELYYGISGSGAVCHTINPRLFADQIVYIVNHANDRFVFLDLTFVPLLESLTDQLPNVEGYIILTDAAHVPETSLPNAMCYEDLIAPESETFAWPVFDENTASSMCYTSGTTGNPKGVVYSHRSTLLHTFFQCGGESFEMSSKAVVLPAVPMFHANAWGLPYAVCMVGAKLVFPGAAYDGASVWELLDSEKVTFAAGVPTIWMMLLEYVRQSGKRFDHLTQTGIGGSAVPLAMVEAFEDEFNVQVFHAWGMTETSPVGTTGAFNCKVHEMPLERRRTYQIKQGRSVFGVKLKIVGDAGETLPRDGETFGELAVKGPWIVGSYHDNDEANKSQFTRDGWFLTGDIATLDEFGYMTIVDRAKDVIKSGGEWISSINLENAAVGHPAVVEAAVIGIAHPKWDERPLLVVVKSEGAEVSEADVLGFLEGKIAKWWMPDAVEFVEELPHTATGKIAKLKLREIFKDYVLPTTAASGG
ncbi:MAG: long-chain-fatty-acid--CoA ligase [Alphaproteobacteria bacterium]|nr:long-chain-fatty-acid--CoA ligase [Alphaproteobacteria bacterium]